MSVPKIEIIKLSHSDQETTEPQYACFQCPHREGDENDPHYTLTGEDAALRHITRHIEEGHGPKQRQVHQAYLHYKTDNIDKAQAILSRL